MDGITITPMDAKTAPEAELRRLNDFVNGLNHEAWPDDAPSSFEAFKTSIDTAPPFHRSFRWIAQRGADLVAYARAGYQVGEDNQHILGGYVGVIPELRRRGIGTALLRRIVETARAEGKRLIFLDGDSFVPASDAVFEHLGGTVGIRETINALRLAELDHELMANWIQRAGERAADYELLSWNTVVPEEHLEAYTDLVHVMNTAPTENLDIEDFILTPEQLRHYEASNKARGVRWWAQVARHRDSGEMAGYTELFWVPHNPLLLGQGGTGVVPEHRGKGLGRWLKAANLEATLRDVPDVTWIRTGNADSNRPMLSINREMGFREYKQETFWQFDTEELGKRIEKKNRDIGVDFGKDEIARGTH